MNSAFGEFSKYKFVFMGSSRRLVSIGGSEAKILLSPSRIQYLKDIFRSEVLITTRWWDPVIALLRLFKPKIVSVFIADGHFSLLNLNKSTNKRHGKNILESGYCDIYLLPDLVSLKAVSSYPGLKYSYRPYYWDAPGIHLLDEADKLYDIVFVYGNDPFFEISGQSKLLTLINRLIEYFGERYSIAHLLPKGNKGKLIASNLPGRENVFVGLDGAKHAFCRGSVYLCTPSTIVWQLLAASGRVALIDVYDRDPCFHSSIPRIRKPADLLDVISKDEEYWVQLWSKMRGVLGKESIVEVLNGIFLEERLNVNNRSNAWRILRSHRFRDLLSSTRSIVMKK